MARMNRQTVVSACLGAFGVLAAATAASAAKAKQAPDLESSVPVWAILITVVALAGISVVAFKNAKRNRAD